MEYIKDGERLDEVNDSLSLIQKTDGLTFGTDALLLASFINCRAKSGIELGSGSGIISLLLLTRGKLADATALEVQEEYRDLTERNAMLNALDDRLTAICTDAREYKTDKSFDLVYTNPPYMKVDSGRANELTKKNIARHEVFGTIGDFCATAARLLKFGGTFAVVYRTDRLIDLIAAMRDSRLEAKRMTFVHADAESRPSMVLVEGKLGAKPSLDLTAPLIIYKDKKHKEYTDDMNYIMENGSFPERFYKTR